MVFLIIIMLFIGWARILFPLLKFLWNIALCSLHRIGAHGSESCSSQRHLSQTAMQAADLQRILRQT